MIGITNPANPQLEGAVDTSGWAHDLAISGNHAYLADNEGLK